MLCADLCSARFLQLPALCSYVLRVLDAIDIFNIIIIVNQSVNQSIRQSIGQSIGQTINRSINRSKNQSVSVNHDASFSLTITKLKKASALQIKLVDKKS